MLQQLQLDHRAFQPRTAASGRSARRVILRTRLITKGSCSQSADQGVVNEALLFLEDLVTLLIGTRRLELRGNFILHQELSFYPPSGTRLDPFKRTARAMKRIE